MPDAILTIAIHSYWHPGTGRGSGFYLDAMTHTGADGLPRLPGRTVKGLLRDALWRAETWGWTKVPIDTTEMLFGSKPKQDSNLSEPGQLRVADATLPDDVADYLSRTAAGRQLIPNLYREHFSTAIEHHTGVVSERSLRGMQVVVPLTLTAELSVMPGQDAQRKLPADWYDRLTAVLPLIPAVGAYRTRGFGRAQLTLARGESCAK
jgi:hypothetical protein